ncbi:MAG: flavodoxin family protein [Bacillota bacterium]
MKKILGISASPRKEATEFAVCRALERAQTVPGITTEYISLRDYNIRPCTHCDYCYRKQAGCVIRDDMSALTEKFLQADGYIIGSPVYTYNPTPELLMFFNRLRPLRFTHPNALAFKVGGALSVGGTRNGGQELTINAIINLYLARGIMVVGGSTSNYAGGKIWTDNRDAQGAQADEVGIATVEDIGVRVAIALTMLKP